MISFSDIERLLEKDIGDIEPEIRQFARGLMEIFNDLEEDLLDVDLPEEERRAVQRMILKAIECHMRRLPPPSEEIKFWMQLLDSKVCLLGTSEQ